MRMRFAPVLAAVWAAGAALPAGATTYFASPAGNDLNPGSLERPWRTLQAGKKILQPGDTLLVADGDYPGGVRFSRDGQPGKPITFKAINPGRAILHGDQTTERDCFTIYEADWIVVDGFVLERANRVGLWVGSGNNVTIRNCVSRNNDVSGILTSHADDLLIENNVCYGNMEQHGIYVSNSGDRPIVRYNVAFNNARCGIQFNGDGKQLKPALGTRGDGIIMRATVDSNIVYDNGKLGGAGFNIISVREGIISNNLIYNNLAAGISFYNDNLASETQWGSKDNLVVFNTIYFRPNEGRWAMSFTRGSSGNTVQNNIISGGYRGAYQWDDTSPFKSDNNLVYSAQCNFMAVYVPTGKLIPKQDFINKTGNDTHSVFAAPKFVNPFGANPDFHLAAGSPALSSGIYCQQVTADLDGNTISDTCKPNLGCYGSTGTTGVSTGDSL
jgi:parallel beta-helix repeat protein